jgi:hypothetical protein
LEGGQAYAQHKLKFVSEKGGRRRRRMLTWTKGKWMLAKFTIFLLRVLKPFKKTKRF